MRTVREEQLVKALSDMEALAKGVSPGMSGQGSKIPKTTAEANGGLSDEGDKKELAVTSKAVEEDDFEDDEDQEEAQVEKAAKGKKGKTLQQWAKEESEEETHKAAADDESDESSDDESDESSDNEDESVTKCKKSMKGLSQRGDLADLIKSDGNAGPVVDVSPFIETLVDSVSEAERDLRKAMIEMHEEQSSYNAGFRKSLVTMGNLVLDMNKKLGQIMDMPTGDRRSVLSKSEIVDRFEETAPEFTKTQVLDTMVDLVQKGKLDALEVSRYEATNSMDPAIYKVVESHMNKSAA